MVKTIHKMVLADSRLKVRTLEKRVGISKSAENRLQKGKYSFIYRQGLGAVFWDAREIILIDYFQKGQPINEEYYANLVE